MQVVEVTVGSSEKVNLGNFENKEFSIFLKANVMNTDFEKSVLELQKKVEAMLERAVTDYLKQNRQRLISGASRAQEAEKSLG